LWDIGSPLDPAKKDNRLTDRHANLGQKNKKIEKYAKCKSVGVYMHAMIA
jgi:hypothetical protein